MLDITEQRQYLKALGVRLREQRLARDDTMANFAQRLGVSAGTLRAMEQGIATVQVGTWASALWVLDRLDDLSGLLVHKESLLDQARAPRVQRRRRASKQVR
jgi:transcriptional regulator with XRE-family HTH domain